MMSTTSRLLRGLFSLFLLFSWMGCAGIPAKKYGRITPDENATVMFEKYEISDDFNYYISGSDVYPNAVMGLSKDYVLDSSLWKKVELTPDRLETIVSYMQDRVRFLNRSQHGAAIYDDQGNRIGIWYSMLEAITAVKMIDDHTVVIYTPDINTYQKYEQD